MRLEAGARIRRTLPTKIASTLTTTLIRQTDADPVAASHTEFGGRAPPPPTKIRGPAPPPPQIEGQGPVVKGSSGQESGERR